jgi:hypothetical protein
MLRALSVTAQLLNRPDVSSFLLSMVWICVLVIDILKVFHVVIRMQQWVPFTLLPSYKTFRMLSTIISFKYYESVSIFLP